MSLMKNVQLKLHKTEKYYYSAVSEDGITARLPCFAPNERKSQGKATYSPAAH